MIYLEEKDWEKTVLAEFSVCVPLEVYQGNTGEAECVTFPRYAALAETFMKCHRDAPLSPDAIRFVRENIAPDMEANGFETDTGEWTAIREYILPPDCPAREELFLPGTELVNSEDGLPQGENLLTQSISSEIPYDETSVIYRLDGKIVAFATHNDYEYEDESVEISVECAPDYRGRGYATACAAHLIRYIHGEGCPARYHCRENNHASIRVAEKLGFRLLGVRYSFVFYRKGAR